MRWMLASSVGEPSTVASTMIGDVSPAWNSVDRATDASRLSMPGGRTVASGMPWLEAQERHAEDEQERRASGRAR